MFLIPPALFALQTPSDATYQPPLHKLWEVKVTDQKAFDQLESFVVEDHKRLYFGTSHTYGVLDIASGKILWWKRIPPPGRDAKVFLTNNSLYVTMGNLKIAACDPATGTSRWEYLLDDYPQPTLAQERLFFAPREGALTALDTRTHKPLWEITLPQQRPLTKKNKVIFTGSPVVQGNFVFVGTSMGSVQCRQASVGNLRWERALPPAQYDHSIRRLTIGTRQLFATTANGLYALDLATGKQLWRFMQVQNSPSVPLQHGGQLYCAVAFESQFGFDADRGTPIAIEFPATLKPFGLASGGWRVLPKSSSPFWGSGRISPLGHVLISFTDKVRRKGSAFRWNTAHTEATVHLGIIYGALDGCLSASRVRSRAVQ